MNIYSKLFAQHGHHCAQILVTKEDFRDRLHYLNIKNCFEALLKNKIIPIVNENDVVSVTELMFTDNDELAGLIAAMLNVDMMLLLTNVDGIFDGHPSDQNSKLIETVDAKTEVEAYIGPDKSSFGRGGMLTKSRIAKKLARLGITTHIANGKRPNILIELINPSSVSQQHGITGDQAVPRTTAGQQLGAAISSAPATTFLPQKNLSSVKRWIATSRGNEKGVVYINECAEQILTSKAKAVSLLPVGITSIEGDFEKGEIIKVRNHKGKDVGYGLAQYSSQKAREVLGLKGQKPLIHYDYFFLECA